MKLENWLTITMTRSNSYLLKRATNYWKKNMFVITFLEAEDSVVEDRVDTIITEIFGLEIFFLLQLKCRENDTQSP
jgi:hypothetical protein